MDRTILSSVTSEGNKSRFVIDWPKLKTVVNEALDTFTISGLRHRANVEKIVRHTADLGSFSSFHGYGKSDVRQWISDGYISELFNGLGDIAPAREKRRYKYVEDGEEILVDRALSGEDNFMATWTKRQVIPGCALEAQIAFQAGTPARIVNAYNAWICKAVASLDAAGIDLKLSLKFQSENVFKSGHISETVVEVKRENELLDFHSFSAMISPAAYRTFGFVAKTLHSEAMNFPVKSGLGNRMFARSDWSVKYAEDTRTVEIDCPYTPNDFPEGKMDGDFTAVIAELR